MVHMRLELLIKKMEELKQKDMAQNYGSASDAVALMPGYAILNTKNNKPFWRTTWAISTSLLRLFIIRR